MLICPSSFLFPHFTYSLFSISLSSFVDIHNFSLIISLVFI